MPDLDARTIGLIAESEARLAFSGGMFTGSAEHAATVVRRASSGWWLWYAATVRPHHAHEKWMARFGVWPVLSDCGYEPSRRAAWDRAEGTARALIQHALTHRH